jgi:hypothetical protein
MQRKQFHKLTGDRMFENFEINTVSCSRHFITLIRDKFWIASFYTVCFLMLFNPVCTISLAKCMEVYYIRETGSPTQLENGSSHGGEVEWGRLCSL